MKRQIAVALTATMAFTGTFVNVMPAMADSSDSKKISITYMEWGDEAPLLEAASNFEALYPNVEVKIDNCGNNYDDYVNKLKVTMAANEGPETFKLEPGALVEQFKDYVVPLDSYFKDEFGDNWKDNFVEGAYDQIEYDGIGWVGVPTYLTLAGSLYVNETILEENNLSIPTNYEELAECCKTLRDNGVNPLAFGAKDDWGNQDFIVTLFNEMAPGKVYKVENGNGKWTDPEMVKALQQWKSYFDDGVMIDGALGLSTYSDTLDMFNSGNAAFFFNGSWNMGTYMAEDSAPQLEKDYKWAVIPLPAPEGAETAVQVALSDMICVNNEIQDDETKEMAYKFAMYMCTDHLSDVSKTQYVLEPAVKGVELNTKFYGESGPKLDESLKDMVQYGKGARELSNVDTRAELLTSLQEIAMGSLSPEDAAARVQAVADQQ